MPRSLPRDLYAELPLLELRKIACSSSAIVDGCRVTVDPDTGSIRYSRATRRPSPPDVQRCAPALDALARAICHARAKRAGDPLH